MKSVIRVLLSSVLMSMICFNSPAQAQQVVKVLVLPYMVNAEQELGYLYSELPDVLKKQLEAAGATIVQPDELPAEFIRGANITEAVARGLGRENDADFVIWGSITWIGQNYSVDTRLLNLLGAARADSLARDGEKIESLPKTIKSLSADIEAQIFKREKVIDVRIAGNQRIEADAVKKQITTAPGDALLARTLSKDLKVVYAMGYFEDIRIEAEDAPDGKIITFFVTEKPTIRSITFQGLDAYDDEDLMAVLDVHSGSVLNLAKIQSSMQQIKSLYAEKNYHNAEVDYQLTEVDNNQRILNFSITEGEKLSVTEIVFEGNTAFDDDDLEGLMRTSEKGILSWITSAGDLNSDDLAQDVVILQSFYQNHGFIQAKIGEPQVDYLKDGIKITIKIDEGPQFQVGEVDIDGDILGDKQRLYSQLKLPAETLFNREVLRNDMLMLTDLYSDEGFAYADVRPEIKEDTENLLVDVTYNITKGQTVYFEKIIITGNTKTRDKVIRRELKVYEQEPFSGRRLKRGIQNLYRLDFFEDIKVDTLKGSAEDKMILKIEVTEKTTGNFSIGGGYSSVESVFATGSITQRNLFGRGQILNLKADVGGRTNRIDLSFTEPWLFDIPLSAGIDFYKWDRDYDTYEKDSIGGALRLGYLLRDYTRAYLSYGYELADVFNIDEDAAVSIKELEGENVTSALSGSLRYDSRDRIFNATRGQDHRLTVKYAGLGGDINFIKGYAESGIYFPLYKWFTGFVHGEAGIVEELQDGLLPDYEKFYLGGPNSMRGFEWRGITALDEDGNEVGGNTFVQFNLEVLFPVLKTAGIMGVVFYDTGNVWGEDENVDLGDLRQSAGAGVRWYSPMGPIRLEYGYILDPTEEEEDSRGRWEFSMGAAF